MKTLTGLALAGICVVSIGASGCNRTLPSMEPYDEYKARLKSSQNIDQDALPVLKTKDGSASAAPAKDAEEKK